jgi:hypothetical protein
MHNLEPSTIGGQTNVCIVSEVILWFALVQLPLAVLPLFS